MGHAGAIIAGGKGTAAEKMAALIGGGCSRRQEPRRHGRGGERPSVSWVANSRVDRSGHRVLSGQRLLVSYVSRPVG